MSAGKIRDRAVPVTRDVDPDLRRRRLLAARRFAWGTVPRVAILLGHWDGGAIVRIGAEIEKPKRKQRKVSNG